MKRTTFLIALAFLVTLIVSCTLERDNPVEPPDPNPMPGLTTIPVGATRTVQPSGLEITFDTILLDNRCPIGAYCFFGGMATIKLYVASSDSDRQALIFHIDAAQPAPDSSRYVVTEAGRFRIVLRNLTPYPNINEPRIYEDYRIALAVEPYQATDSVVGAVVPSRLPASTLCGESNTIGSVRVFGSQLKMTVTYGGGCHRHGFTLFMDPIVFAESAPVQANLYLHHFGDGDFCQALITEELAFDLQPMLDLHMQYYGREDQILLNVFYQPDSTWVLKEQVLYEPPEYYTAILPMAIGNYWIYADTSWRGGVTESSIDTVKVVDHVTDYLGDWWVLSQPLLSLGDRIMLKGDSIYTHQDTWYGEEYAVLEYIPPVDTPVTYNVGYSTFPNLNLVYQRTVCESDTIITAPAGTFNNLWVYESNVHYPDPWQQFFKPSVGFVYTYQQYTLLTLGGPVDVTRRAWLVEYHVQE